MQRNTSICHVPLNHFNLCDVCFLLPWVISGVKTITYINTWIHSSINPFVSIYPSINQLYDHASLYAYHIYKYFNLIRFAKWHPQCKKCTHHHNLSTLVTSTTVVVKFWWPPSQIALLREQDGTAGGVWQRLPSAFPRFYWNSTSLTTCGSQWFPIQNDTHPLQKFHLRVRWLWKWLEPSSQRNNFVDGSLVGEKSTF